jgi:NADPH-dependent 7-cyano-7-deazaguanine reductase QueF-like protein
MSEENKKHLFNLENTEDNDGIEMVFVPKDQQDQEEEYDDDFVALLLNEVKKNLKTPTLDQLLDKIKSEGVESLTQYEMGLLESHSKN